MEGTKITKSSSMEPVSEKVVVPALVVSGRTREIAVGLVACWDVRERRTGGWERSGRRNGRWFIKRDIPRERERGKRETYGQTLAQRYKTGQTYRVDT